MTKRVTKGRDDIPWEEIPRNEIARALLAKLKTAKDLSAIEPSPGVLGGPGLTASDFKYSDDEVLPALYTVVVDSVRNGTTPPSTGSIHVALLGVPLEKLAERVRHESLDARLDQAIETAVGQEKGLADPSDVIDTLLDSLGKLKAGTNGTVPTAAVTFKEYMAQPLSPYEWLWEPFIMRGSITLLSGHPKSGKSTLLYQLLKAMQTGEDFLGYPTIKTKVYLATEDPPNMVVPALDSSLATEEAGFVFSQPWTSTWEALVADITTKVHDNGITLVVIDTLIAAWQLSNENDSMEVEKALRPLKSLAQDEKTAIILLHHLRKQEGAEGTQVGGSRALTAAVNISLELRSDEGKASSRRRLSMRSNYRMLEPQLIEYDVDTREYTSRGAVQTQKRLDTEDQLMLILEQHAQGSTLKEFKERMTVDVAYNTVRAALTSLEQAGQTTPCKVAGRRGMVWTLARDQKYVPVDAEDMAKV